MGTEKSTSSKSILRNDAAFRADFRQRYASRGAHYEEYEPAYRYGVLLRERYALKLWSDIEQSARRDWELDRPGTWDHFKEAIRKGWEKSLH